ncbi:hypothetical protein TDB9533_02699 [Thalassocella blandensis]|nr:hypothetical protein TDB9533_02699 [Thalassocella blandensis]
MSNEFFSNFFQQHAVKGFLAEDEGLALYEKALAAADIGPCLEIGSYCGKSTVYLGLACKETHNTLYAVDHHRGSEEHQLGEEYHDPDLYDKKHQCMDSFPEFRKTIQAAQVDKFVVPVVASSELTVRHWQTPLGMVFVDGGHSHQMAMNDCVSWSRKLAVGGILAVHDLFALPEEGGQGPHLAFEHIASSRQFERLAKVNSLGFLRRIA